MTMRILFVDDEEKVLDGLRRMLRPLRHEWTCEFARSGNEALARMATLSFDVVVSDMRMPGMDGAELLARVRETHPGTVRIVLSGHSDMESILRSVGPSHQYLTKPCDAETLKRTIASACALRDLFDDNQLQHLVGQLDTLPSMPALYRSLVMALQSPETSLRDVGRIVATDLGMTAQVLRLVNSSYFGLCNKIASPERAVSFLGLSTVTSLALCAGVFQDADALALDRVGLASLWSHSVATAMSAKRIAHLETKDARTAEDSFAAGMLHDAGMLVLATNMPDRYGSILRTARTEHRPLWQVEEAELGCSHAAVGAYLLGLWGIPNAIVEAVAYHHGPSLCPNRSFAPLTAVHAADVFDEETRFAETTSPPPVMLDLSYLEDLGCRDRLETWRAECELHAACAEEA